MEKLQARRVIVHPSTALRWYLKFKIVKSNYRNWWRRIYTSNEKTLLYKPAWIKFCWKNDLRTVEISSAISAVILYFYGILHLWLCFTYSQIFLWTKSKPTKLERILFTEKRGIQFPISKRWSKWHLYLPVRKGSPWGRGAWMLNRNVAVGLGGHCYLILKCLTGHHYWNVHHFFL